MPTLRVFDHAGSHRDHLLGDRAVLGRDPTAEVWFRDTGVGRRHALIERRGDAYVVVDMGSATGVQLVDGRRVLLHPLQDGDRFRCGRAECQFLAEPSAPLPALERRAPAAVARVHRPDGSHADFPLGGLGDAVGDHAHAAVRVPGGVRRHARIVAFAGRYWIEAHDGALAQGGAAVDRCLLTPGEPVEIGGSRLELRLVAVGVLRVYVGEDPQRFTDYTLGARTRIGTRSLNDVVLRDLKASREHCRVELQDDVFYVEDLGSTNGVLLNGERIARQALRHGDRLQLGDTVCVFLDDPERPTPGLVALHAALERAGLARPPVPTAFWPLLQQFAPWWFGTRRTRGLYQYGAMLLAEADDTSVADYAIVGHAGHSAGAFALHYFVRRGPLLLVLELAHGGPTTDEEVARAGIAEAFAAAEALLAAAPVLTGRGVPNAGLRVMISTLGRSCWQAGALAAEGPWQAVLRAACAWAASDAAFVPAPEPPRARTPAAAVGAAPDPSVDRLRVYTPDQTEPREHAIGRELVIGRHATCDLQLGFGYVSRRHCRVFELDGLYWVEDLGSTQGTRVEGKTIHGPCVLAHGARILLGQVEVVYCEAGQPAPPRLRLG
jgi:pSer/pThr/pTyr-binding forkhead associated (FHA) protein